MDNNTFSWKACLVYSIIAAIVGYASWYLSIIYYYGEPISSDNIDRYSYAMIALVAFMTFFMGMLSTPLPKVAGHVVTIMAMCITSLLFSSLGAYIKVHEYAQNGAKSYTCPVTWVGPKATLACEYGTVELIASAIPMEYHMRPLPNKGTCRHKVYGSASKPGKFEDCKIFNEISSH